MGLLLLAKYPPVIFISGLICLISCSDHNPYGNNMGIQAGVVAMIDTSNYTVVEWIDSTSNFGAISAGDTVVMKYRFKNAGEKPLFITAVQPSCGCTVTDYPKDIIRPGKEGVITARFDSKNKKGYIHKTILVTTNTLNHINHQLSFQGSIK